MSAYKPKIYRSQDGCCICKAKSSRLQYNDDHKCDNDVDDDDDDGVGWKQILVGVECGECTQQTDYVPAHYLQTISSSLPSSSSFKLSFCFSPI